MIDSTTLAIIDEGPAGTTQLVVEADTGRQAQEALQDALGKAGQGAGPVPLQGEDVFAGPEYGLDALADGSQVRTRSGLVFSFGTDVDSVNVLDGSGELFARVAFVGKQDLPASSWAAPKQLQSHLPFVALGRGERKPPGGAVTREEGVQAHPPEVAGVRGTVPIVTQVRKSGAKNCLPAAGALDRGGVDEQKIVIEPRALLGKDEKEPFQDGRQSAAALEIAGLPGQLGEEVGETSLGRLKEPAVRGNAHDSLGHAQGDDLGIGGSPTGVFLGLWQKIIGCAINDGAESVEVGVHRGLQADDVYDTVGFGLSASNPFCTAIFVESII
jgi:hypothetical protein